MDRHTSLLPSDYEHGRNSSVSAWPACGAGLTAPVKFLSLYKGFPMGPLIFRDLSSLEIVLETGQIRNYWAH